ncbi:MAG: hypothetical protein ACREXW_16875 [Gammaproteobacteria bacterium]
MLKGLLFAGITILPVHADAACTLKNLQGRYSAIIAAEFDGWQRCNVRVNANGLATGICLTSTGDTVLTDPIQFSVSPSCFVSGTSASGVFSYSLRMQPHKRGLIGRFRADDGVNLFEGPAVAVKRGK